ncbi:hypothetical protein NXX03_19190 [Bacteroides thetaiotaomicron]|nr:hypothetical protein [Bacteroides thetaiotaomicron]MCS3370158.1 hypothetical protein [Bacteroides thetaiotaomicron]
MAGKVITPKQLAQQWLRLPNKFEVNVFNFETLVGNAAKKYLETLFISGGSIQPEPFLGNPDVTTNHILYWKKQEH